MTRATIVLEALRNRFWILPAAAIVIAIAAGLALPALDPSVRLPDAVSFSGGPDTARSLLAMIATVAVSIAGISFSVIVVALVLASQQLSPRVLRSFQRHPLNQGVLALFLATAAFSLVVLGSIGDGEDRAPELSVTIAMVFGAFSLAAFIGFLHHIVRSLNASAVIRRIAADGHQAIEDPYPASTGDPVEEEREAEDAVRRLVEAGARREVRAPRAGYVVSIDGPGLVAAAERCEGFVEQRREIGRFVVTGGLLAVVWCGRDALDELASRVNRAFVLNEERVVDDDVAFPLRQLADVALKGLSPGINDPTTSENAMDSAVDNLVRFARQEPQSMLRTGSDGAPRLRALAPTLDTLVRLAFEQVRRDAASRPSFAVRLLELLADLREAGGPRAAGCEEIARQARAVRNHAVALADIPADAEMVRSAYERLHARGEGVAEGHDGARVSRVAG